MSATLPITELSFTDGAHRTVERPLAQEVPVAFEFSGIGYAVMMATPTDLADFAIGFALSEGLIARGGALPHPECAEVEGGWVVRMVLPPDQAERLHARTRLRLVEGSCGLCGMDSIAEVLRPLPRLDGTFVLDANAVARALATLPTHQTEGMRTGAMHAAAFCAPDGAIRLLREDVGRHNALDKLIGACARQGIDPASGFFLVSARCSYELVEKSVRAGCPALVAISAPTSLAVERARAARLTLVALARQDSMLILSNPTALMEETSHGL